VITRTQVHPLAPLEPWLNDPDVIDIVVDGYSKVYVRRRSLDREFEEVSTPFRGHEHLMEVIDTAMASMGRMIDPWAPFVDVCLPDGSQLNAMVPPLTPIGPALAIRKSIQES
jgi:pilus assembly protein CpaF